MNETMERLLDETREASERRRREAGALAGSATLAPGDVAHAGPTESEWAVLARDGAGRLHVVPADAGTFAGSGDVTADGEAGGPWMLRCRHGLWVEPARLEPSTPTGRLTAQELERARERASGRASGVTVLERETDEDPEYREWIEDVVEPARGVLATKGAAVEPMAEEAETDEATLEETRTASAQVTRWRTLAAVAAILLVAAVTLSGFRLWRQEVRIGNLVEAATRRAVAGNVLSVVLFHEDRGETTLIRVPAGFENVLLSLLLDEPASAAGFLLEVRTEAGEPVWTGDGQKAQDDILRLVLPVSLVPPGRYLLRVSRLGAGEHPELVAEHAIRLVEGEP